MKNSILLFLGLFMFSGLQAKYVDPQAAMLVAKNAWFERASLEFTVDYDQIRFEKPKVIERDNHTLIYIFNESNSKGFLMIAADNQAYPLLGYSFQGIYNDSADLPPAFRRQLNIYTNQIAYIISNKIPADERIQNAWEYFRKKPAGQKSSLLSVSPLLSTTWDQGCYYNAQCPSNSNGPCGHVWAGCVATAMGQIMKYHSHPLQGNGSHSYNMPGYGNLSANFGNTTYTWSNMPNSLSTANADVAQLLYHCGISVNMYYSASGSGAMSANARDALINYFHYQESAQIIYKSYFTTSNWENTLANELDAGRPIYYAGDDPSAGGHAFVCDGYQGTNHFHFNWGWSGYYNGYFYVSSLSPGSTSFTANQEAIIGIKPIDTICSGLSTEVSEYGTISDGSGIYDYGNNNDCRWLIQPPGSVALILSFSSFDTENTYDVVEVYDGADTTATLLGSFSGSTVPANVVSSGGSMFIRFRTNDSIRSSGWAATYYNTLPPKCSGTTTLTDSAATIDDGSGSGDYGNMTDCYWLIKPQACTSVSISFTSFDTELGYDVLKIYNGETTSDPLLLMFSGTNIPPSKTSSGPMLLHFKSDEYVTGGGWSATYTSTSNTEIAENEIDLNILLYPNPVKDMLNIKMQSDLRGEMQCDINDLSGRNILAAIFTKNQQQQEFNLNLNDLQQGVYFLHLSCQGENRMMKFMKQ